MQQISIALSGGGAAGLGHIQVLRAFDDLGVKPACISGTSIGAMIGVCFAAGMSALEIENHCLEMADHPTRTLLTYGRNAMGNSVRWRGPLDAHAVVTTGMPHCLPERIEDLNIPATIVATDYYQRCATGFSQGDLLHALAASIAIPGIISPVKWDGTVYTDGGVTNNCPVDMLPKDHIRFAVDTVTYARVQGEDVPGVFTNTAESMRIMMQALLEARFTAHPPDVLIRPDSRNYNALDFRKAREILNAARPAYEQTKRELKRVLAQRRLG
jgi:NTE family protein